jgi:hypothetical protein
MILFWRLDDSAALNADRLKQLNFSVIKTITDIIIFRRCRQRSPLRRMKIRPKTNFKTDNNKAKEAAHRTASVNEAEE